MRKVSFILAILILFFTAGCSPRTTADSSVYLTLVNKQNALPADWTETIELESATNVHGEEFLVEKEALKHFNELRAELLEEGVDIELDSTYRSVEEQQEIWDEWANDPELGVEYCKKYLAVPGYSEHHTGLAIDVFLIQDGKDIRDNEDMIAERETFAKVHAKLAKHGFILRYPEDKKDVTGYAYEPWHFRYVGSPPNRPRNHEQQYYSRRIPKITTYPRPRGGFAYGIIYIRYIGVKYDVKFNN